MAKKKAGGVEKESKKNAQKKKQQSIDDKTFGLKNKNKSKKVQSQVQQVVKSVLHSGDAKVRKAEEERAKQKVDRKLRVKAAKDEQDALFSSALLAVQKKGSTSKKEGKVEAQGRDGADENTKKSTSRAMKMMFQMDAQEMNDKLKEDPNYVPTLEDEIEDQRQKKVAELKASGKAGTPVTQESFAVWQEIKRKKRVAEAKKKVEVELKKKKGGKGLSVLSGRDLYEYKKDLFKDKEDSDDDSGGGDDIEEDTINNNDSKPAPITEENVEQVAEQVQSDLFLEGDDEDLDDLMDD
mmetsp:Transcript_1767/g.2507  ORF Transcript_1767/g.2507 Transcript_1767/m.2507 type:complete len:295 (-) Transcript_1767:53-937(-)|eukprot:CAMPEP_0198140548 /NCGR_PEP_ID=MMETSP1443-20131203/3688_1 /TAXON_ID=186043 /ORGANISM="Entomoneis sp., Strain CCMP2396" /LENGTH=294 /DNA_ID=CAMNT_0043803007 /DNA_START=243 /DNA_END=1127 /DNA_ORIENTATION=+